MFPSNSRDPCRNSDMKAMVSWKHRERPVTPNGSLKEKAAYQHDQAVVF